MHGIASRKIREQTRERLGTTRATTRKGTQRQTVFNEIVQVQKKATSIGTGSEFKRNVSWKIGTWHRDDMDRQRDNPEANVVHNFTRDMLLNSS